MWCFQKPGFDALLLAELQRQQQCSQFCDTLLKTEGVLVPAHSCILAAISPCISSALSSMPTPPAGQSRLLEFRALGACTLLHMVRLLYSGEMAGEGEREKQEAVSAAAKLGIHGLVEVTKRDRKSRGEEGGGRRADAGVQTEPPTPEENEGRRGRWRREVRDGSTILWKETLSDGERDTWTQTEELQVNTAPPPHPAGSFDTIDVAALQSLGQTDSHLLPPQIPYIPISLVYPPDGNHGYQASSAAADSLQESAAAEHAPVAIVAPPYTCAPPSLPLFSSQGTVCAAGPECWSAGAAGEVAVAEECEQLAQFEGNIPGYISYFLDPDKEGSRRGRARGRARRRRGAGGGGARSAGTGERRARRPQARRGGRGRGGWTQTVDVQEVGVSRLPKWLLQRGGMRTSRTGQGGGAAGRKLYLETRELLKQTNSCQRRRGRGKVWEFSQSGDVRGGGAGRTPRGRSNTTQQQQFHRDGLPAAGSKPTPSIFFSSPPVRFHNVHTLSASSPSLQPSPSPGLLSPAAPYRCPASPLRHTTSLPPPQEPEHFERLLEEVMMGLDILPSNRSCAPHSQPPPPPTGNTLAHKQQGSAAGALEAGPGFSSANSEGPVLQQQGEGELNEMLEHFLQSFEQHVDSGAAGEEAEAGGQSCAEAGQPYTALSKYRRAQTQTTATPYAPHPQSTRTPHPIRRPPITDPQQSDEAETQRRGRPRARGAVRRKPAEGGAAGRRPNKRTEHRHLSAPEKRSSRVRKPVSSGDAEAKVFHDRVDKLLLQMPVVKLEKSGPLPARVLLRGHSCSSLEVKSSAQSKSSSSSEKYPHGSSSEKTPVSWITKKYPIRSRIREAHIVDSVASRQEPPPDKRPPSAGRPRRQRGRPRKNRCLSVATGGQQPVEPRVPDEQLDKNPERHEEEEVQPQEEAGPTRKGKKRRPESGKKETSDGATVAKRVCSKPTPEPSKPTSAPADLVPEPATVEAEDVVDVATALQTSVGDCLQVEERETVRSEIQLRETEEGSRAEETKSSDDEVIDVDGDVDDAGRDLGQSAAVVSPASPPAGAVSQEATGSCREEDVDVIGGSSPVPEPVIISWTESSEGEEGDEEGDEEVDVVGEEADFISLSKGEFVDRSYRTEMRLH